MENRLSENILTDLDGSIKVNEQFKKIPVLNELQIQSKYKLDFEIIELLAEKNYFIIYFTFEDGTVNTYFFPIQFVGLNSITFDVNFVVSRIEFMAVGDFTVKDIALQGVIEEALTEEQKIALNKVSTNSDYWDRIIAVTSALGNVLTDKLEGSINTALNSISGAEGRMYWENGKFIVRDEKTDAESTMAMLLSPAGFMIANGKLKDGSWDWRTFGTGAGFTADEIMAGTLRAIAIEGVNITASVLTGGEIIGAKIRGGSLNINDKFIVDSEGDVQMSGDITWGADNSPVKVKYSSNNTDWHYGFQVADIFAKYSYDGGLTWTQGIKIRGTDGLNGVPGTNGTDGMTYYTWIAYADTSIGGGISLNAANKKYIGIAYNQLSQTPQLTANKYAWSKIIGEDGLGGSDGLPGKNGSDGKIYYVWVRYADSPTSGMSDSPDGKEYIGIAYNKETQIESEAYGEYTWSKIRGEQGVTGAQGPTGPQGVQGPQGPAGSNANVPGYIQSTKITGTTIESCTISANTINGSTINGSRIINGNTSSGDYSDLSSNGTFQVFQGGKEAVRVWANKGFGGYFMIFDKNGDEVMRVQADDVAKRWLLTSLGNADLDFVNNSVDLSIRELRIINDWDVAITGGLQVYGYKDAIVPTQHYGARRLYCEESDRVYFNTKGICETEKCSCMISLDPIFLETIELNSICPYIINVTPYGDAKVWVEEVNDAYFVVRSDKDVKFSYNLQAIRISFKKDYLGEVNADKRILNKVQEAVVQRRMREE